LSNKKGKLYLIPCTLGAEGVETIPDQTKEAVKRLDHFLVERIRSARRYIRQVSKDKSIDDIQFIEWDKRSENQNQTEVKATIQWLLNGIDVGVLSEAGAPCVADPGNLVVEAAHKSAIDVIPLTGPSSMFLALMASGMNGQSFAFHGYLPVKKEDLPKALLRMESSVGKMKQTQLFMETPYRNDQLWEEALKVLRGKTRLGYAVDLTLPSQDIKVRTVDQWKNTGKPSLHKRPCIFMLTT